MNHTRGIEWRRRGDPPINSTPYPNPNYNNPSTSPTVQIDNFSNSLYPPPLPPVLPHTTEVPVVPVQNFHQVQYINEENDNSFPSTSNPNPNPNPTAGAGLEKIPNDDNLSSISSSSSSLIELGPPPMNPLKYLGQDVNVVLNCYMIKIGSLMLRVLDGDENEIKVTISNYGSGGFIQIKATSKPKPDSNHKDKEPDLKKVEDNKDLDFLIPLLSVMSFKANVENEFKNNNTFFLKVTLEEAHRIRVLLNVSLKQFDTTPSGPDEIQKKYIKFATPSPISQDDVERLLYIFGTDRMTLIEESTSQFYLHGSKIGKIRSKNRNRRGKLKELRKPVVRILDDDPYFVCDSIHLGTYAYQGRNRVYISTNSKFVSITMKESLGKQMVRLDLPIGREVTYKLARYDQDGEHKLMLYVHLKDHRFVKLFGTELGLDLGKHFKPESLVDPETMFVVLLIRTRDKNEFYEVKNTIMLRMSTRPCQYVVELPIIDEILKNSKSRLK